jgi:transcriptional regulator with XRE-family HTH domain
VSTAQLAKALHLSEAAVSRWRKGKRIPNADALYLVLRAVGGSADEVLGLGDDATVKPALADAALPPHDVELLQKRLERAEAALQSAREITQGRRK